MPDSPDSDIFFGPAGSEQDLHQILALQQLNLPGNISREEALSQGFVTVEHDLGLLTEMYRSAPQIVAMHKGRVVGYALSMLPSFSDRVPVLVPMFERINGLSWDGRNLADWRYYTMGQVCVAKEYRGMGIFDGLYAGHRRFLYPKYEAVITEVATRNTRSIRAHERVGFETLEIYTVPEGEEWALIGMRLDAGG
ncbi:MAG TPA: hypothetical protein PKE06_19915 [Flavilitoribacter sp.]|nr:hypothetical protein [Flavilitoribacter sp.]HMQ90177.1 hypothetical protein [Flavilitoribacter sp.]